MVQTMKIIVRSQIYLTRSQLSISSLKRGFSSFRLPGVARRDEDKWEPLDSLGETGATVARNIRRIRKSRGLPYTEFSEQLTRLGREIPTWGLRKIESGGRRVDTDDLVAIAIVLRVSPPTLLMPCLNVDGVEIETGGDLVPITGWHVPISARPVWDWITAERPFFGDEDLVTFAARSWPRFVRENRLGVIQFPGESQGDGND